MTCEWVHFDSDGNPLYRAAPPDFSAILGIVIEFARGYGGSRVNGGGVVEVADVTAAALPPAEAK